MDNEYFNTLEYWRLAASDVNFDALAKEQHIANRIECAKLCHFLPWPTIETRHKWMVRANELGSARSQSAVEGQPVAMLIAVTDHRSVLSRKVVLAIPLAHSPDFSCFAPVKSGQAPLINPLVLNRPDCIGEQTSNQCAVGNEEGVYLADEEEYQAYLLRNDVSSVESWSDYWRYTNQLIKYLTGYGNADEGLSKKLSCDIHWRIVNWQPDVGSHTLGKLYFDLQQQTNVPLFRRVADAASHVPKKFGINEALPGFSSMLGHMDVWDAPTERRQGFALDPSQRMAAAALTQTDEGNLLAVNGPPGTGKTSFLRSVVATEYINAALQGRQAPVILSTGTTNKAVVNVIDAFLCVPDPVLSPSLTSRWIQNAPSYGWYFPSKPNLKKPINQQHMLLTRSSNGHPQAFELRGAASELIDSDPSSLDGEVVSFLRLHAECFDLEERLQQIGDAVDHLRAQLIGSVNGMRRLQSQYLLWLRRQGYESHTVWCGMGANILDELVAKGYEATSLKGWLAEAESNPFGQIIKVEASLDKSYRFYQFHLAARYWEARWLHRRQQRTNNPCQIPGLELRDLAMLAPVFVCTTHMLPRVSAQFNHADLLVFDEAGQASVEAGAGMFAFAKRAIVLGDIHQLSPVYRISPARDRDISRQLRLHRLPSHRRVSDSSVMKLAQAVTQWTDFDGDRPQNAGINLMQHYRCRSAIIGYCQEIVYGSNLKPCRKEPEKKLLPAMGWVAVSNHLGEERISGSRVNWDEIHQITRWLKEMAPRLLEHYGETSLAKVVAIISPFAAQVKHIKAAVQEALPPHLVGDMIIGTVHALQGAEIPVVAFSLTQTEGPFFVEREGPNLLNVAVSRAKDSFIVFASRHVWENLDEQHEEDTPMRVLHRYMKRHGQRAYPRECYLIEAPGKIDAVSAALGINAKVLPTMGNFKKLVARQGKLRFENVSDFVERVLTNIVIEHHHYDHIYLATDDDDDGEEIAWHLRAELSRLGLPPTTKVSRMRFHAITPELLNQARQDANPIIDLPRVQINIAKKAVDLALHERMRAAGLNVTRPQWMVLSELSRRHATFQKWAMAWGGDCQGTPVSGWVERHDGKRAYWPTRDRVDTVCRRLRSYVGLGPLPSKVAKKKYRSAPTTTANVLVFAYQRFGWRPKKTMTELRALYEGRRRLRVVGANGPGHMQVLRHGGVISYPRTEGTSPMYPMPESNQCVANLAEATSLERFG